MSQQPPVPQWQTPYQAGFPPIPRPPSVTRGLVYLFIAAATWLQVTNLSGVYSGMLSGEYVFDLYRDAINPLAWPGAIALAVVAHLLWRGNVAAAPYAVTLGWLGFFHGIMSAINVLRQLHYGEGEFVFVQLSLIGAAALTAGFAVVGLVTLLGIPARQWRLAHKQARGQR